LVGKTNRARSTLIHVDVAVEFYVGLVGILDLESLQIAHYSVWAKIRSSHTFIFSQSVKLTSINLFKNYSQVSAHYTPASAVSINSRVCCRIHRSSSWQSS
jgi:hypothetical protein